MMIMTITTTAIIPPITPPAIAPPLLPPLSPKHVRLTNYLVIIQLHTYLHQNKQ